MSIGKKLIGSICIIIITVASGIGISSILQTSQVLKGQVIDVIPLIAINGAAQVRLILDNKIASVKATAETNRIRSMEWEQQQQALKQGVKEKGMLRTAIVSGGFARFNDGNQEAVSVLSFYREIMATEETVSDVFIDRKTNMPYLIITIPIRVMEGKPSAFLLAFMDASWLSELTDRLGYGKKGYAYIIDGKGRLIAHKNREYVRTQRNFLEEGKTRAEYAELSAMFQKMTRGETGFDEYEFLGSKRFFGYGPIAGTNWSLAVGAHKTDVFYRLPEIQKTLVLLSLGFVFLGILFAVLFTRTIVMPIGLIVAIVKHLSQGDLTKRIVVKTSDELGNLSGSFNAFIDKLQGLIASIAGNATTVAASAIELSSVSTQIAANSKEMSAQTSMVASATEQATANIKFISSAAEEMSSSTNNVASAIEEISLSLNEVARNCQKELTIAAGADSYAKNGKNVMDKLGDAAKSIGNVVEVINDIADQTNLLALNATIEAASAGEAGKGFAVVASEVKELAKQTAEATQEIQKQVENMRDNTLSAIKAIESVSKVIEEVNMISLTIVSAVEEQSATVNKISMTVSEVSAGALEVSKNVTESADGLSEISSTIACANNAAADTAKGIAQVKTRAVELSELSEGLKTLIGQFII
jgi:methyl-accepting chemotaxis protein